MNETNRPTDAKRSSLRGDSDPIATRGACEDRGMRNVIRVGVVLGAAVALAASASAPQAHKVKGTAEIPVTFDAAWSAVIDLFAERNWQVQTIERDSGLIATDWIRLSAAEEDTFADCGSAPLATDEGTTVRFNVHIKEDGDVVQMTVGTSFKQRRSFDGNVGVVDCASKGAIEPLIRREVERRAENAPMQKKSVVGPATAVPPTARGFYCTTSATTPTAGSCAREKSACLTVRDAVIGTVTDLSACGLTETAQCADGRCFPTLDACAAAVERAGDGTCQETK